MASPSPSMQPAGRGALTDAPVRCVRPTSTTELVAALELPRANVTYDLQRSGIGFASTPTVLMQVPGRRDTQVGRLPIFRREFAYAKRRDTVRPCDLPFPGHSGRRDALPGGGCGLDFMGGGVVRRGVATAPPHDGMAASGGNCSASPGAEISAAYGPQRGC